MTIISEGVIVNTEYLASGKLVDEVVAWLCGPVAKSDSRYEGRVVKTPEGAMSLDHIMVVVPTAQSGRSLRLALAKQFAKKESAVIPPRIVQPARLVVPMDCTSRSASSTEIAAAFQQYVKNNRSSIIALSHIVREEEFEDLTARFALLDQLEDIWRILAGRGLLMRDVPELGKEILEGDIGDEKVRWDELSKLEEGFFAYLESLGLVYPTKLVRDAKTAAAIVPDEVTEIVLPALADPIRVLEDVLDKQIAAGKKVTVLVHANERDGGKFDKWGRPKTECWIGVNRPILSMLSDEDIVIAANSSSLARKLADDYPPADGSDALPSLALCDTDLFESVSGAFLARGYDVHSPERHMLAQSSLGCMIRNLITIYNAKTLPWKGFVQFFRSDDVLSALGLADYERFRVLEGLDIAQNTYIPSEIPQDFHFPEDERMRKFDKEKFDEFCAQGRVVEAALKRARLQKSLSGFLREMLKWVFAKRRFSHGANEKEFQAAADSARKLLSALDGELVSSLPIDEREMSALALRELGAACYSLEPDSPEAVKTEGWLELAWSSADRIALAGLHEGKVPDSIIGHPFLPDKLRKALGLVSNDDRLARDTWLLSELLDSHSANAVRAYVARTNDDGDICRPSRLLYLCSDGALSGRIKCLFGDVPDERSNATKMIDWPLRLPDAVETPDHFSPSAIDAYVKCPFNYFLKYGLGMKPYKEKRELGADDFGTLAHAALEMYANIQIAEGDNQLTCADDIRRLFAERIFPEIRKKYENAPLNIELQLKALEGRISLFADVQASWAMRGWRIRKAEFEIPKTLDVPDLGFRIHGFIDRVDENITSDCSKRWCIIDYKTWDEKKKITGHVYTSRTNTEKNGEHLEFARRMGYPLIDGRQRILSVQLPVYGKCLAASENDADFASLCFQYLILGKNADEVGFKELNDGQVAACLETAKKAVENIRANIFWPPGPGDEWKYDFNGLFVEDPVKDIGATHWAKAHQKEDGNV